MKLVFTFMYLRLYKHVSHLVSRMSFKVHVQYEPVSFPNPPIFYNFALNVLQHSSTKFLIFTRAVWRKFQDFWMFLGAVSNSYISLGKPCPHPFDQWKWKPAVHLVQVQVKQ